EDIREVAIYANEILQRYFETIASEPPPKENVQNEITNFCLNHPSIVSCSFLEPHSVGFGYTARSVLRFCYGAAQEGDLEASTSVCIRRPPLQAARDTSRYVIMNRDGIKRMSERLSFDFVIFMGRGQQNESCLPYKWHRDVMLNGLIPPGAVSFTHIP